jgi:exosortase/archaeosortase family protein
MDFPLHKLICFSRLNSLRAAELILLSFLITLSGNVLRSTALFYLEAGLLPLQGFSATIAHTGIGISVFALAAVLIAWRAASVKSEKTFPGNPIRNLFLFPRRLSSSKND